MLDKVGNDEILGKNDKIIIGSMLLFIVLLLFLLNQFGYFKNSERDAVLDAEFKTSIVGKYSDRNNHNSSTLKLSNGKEMVNYFPNYQVELNIGDSLVKKKISTDMQVYRKQKLIYSINLLER